jgi:hypothetical protein
MMDEKLKVWSVTQILRQLPDNRTDAQEVLELVDYVVGGRGEMPAALKEPVKGSKPKKLKRRK